MIRFRVEFQRDIGSPVQIEGQAVEDRGRSRSRAGLAQNRVVSFVRVAGVLAALLYVIAGPLNQVQLFGDGSLFSYAIAVQDSWAYHWHNIPVRLVVYVLAHLPAETYIGHTGDVAGGLHLYGLVFYAAPLAGLGLTWVADGSPGRVVFTLACLSTAVLLPLVFGFPTEMWFAHSAFWPTLALAHAGPGKLLGALAVSAAMVALVLTHEGALIFAAAILATLIIRGDARQHALRATIGFAFALAIWLAIKLSFPLDAYFASALPRAALDFLNLGTFADRVMLLLMAALVGYASLFAVLRHRLTGNAHLVAAGISALGLVAYWTLSGAPIHANERYPLRTILLIGTPLLGLIAITFAYGIGQPWRHWADRLAPSMVATRGHFPREALAGALIVVLFLHAGETARFLSGWSQYRAAVAGLAMGTASDPAMGDDRFVTARRIDEPLRQLAWRSTTQYLTVLLAPRYRPQRLVVDPGAFYFWLGCRLATRTELAERAIPRASRALVARFECLNRTE